MMSQQETWLVGRGREWMASKNAEGKREVTDHLGQATAGESWKRRIEPQPPAANQPATIRPIMASAITTRIHFGRIVFEGPGFIS